MTAEQSSKYGLPFPPTSAVLKLDQAGLVYSLFQDEASLIEELEELGQILTLQISQSKQPDIRDILTHKGIRKHTFALFFIW